jgi:hypothetical protein
MGKPGQDQAILTVTTFTAGAAIDCCGKFLLKPGFTPGFLFKIDRMRRFGRDSG